MRTLLISGANRGIGRAVAERALADGHRLSLGLRDLEALKQTPLDPDLAGSERVLLCPYAAEDPAAAQPSLRMVWHKPRRANLLAL